MAWNPKNPGLIQHLAWIREGRDERNQEILRKLNALGMRLSYEEVTQACGQLTWWDDPISPRP
jgi:hypothetical protein